MTPYRKYLTSWISAFILILGFVLRMSQPDLVEFKRDEATVTRLGQAIAFEGYRPVVGVDSSVGIDNLPLTLYLMALPLRINPDPISAVIFTIALNVCAVALCFWFTQRIFGTPAALLTTLLFAVNPWAILYARKIWCRTLPLFTLLFMLSNIAVFIWGKRWAIVGSFISLAALLALQLEGLAFVPIFILAVLLYREKVAWKPFIVGMLIFCVLLLPYAVFDARQNWANLKGLFAYSAGGGVFNWNAIRYAFSLAGTAGISGQAGVYHREFKAGVPDLWFVNDVLSVLLVSGFIYALTQAFRAEKWERRRLFILLLMWFAIPILLQLRPSSGTQPHYFVLHYPVQFMLISIVSLDGLTWLSEKASTRIFHKSLFNIVKVGLIGLLLIWVGWQIDVTCLLRDYMVEHPTAGGYGIPLRYTRSIAHEARQLAQGAEIVVVADHTQPMMTEIPTVFDALFFGTPHRFIDGRGAMLFPAAERTVYVLTPLEENKQTTSVIEDVLSLDSVTAGPQMTLPDGYTYRTYKRIAEDTSDVTTSYIPLSNGIPFANNVVFAAFDADRSLRPGDDLCVKLAWWLHGPPPPNVDYHFTVQLMHVADESLKMISQDDHAAFPANYWQGGDTVIGYFSLPLPLHLPNGEYVVRAGMYSYPDITPVPVVNPEGQPVDDSVQLTTFTFAH